MDFGSTWPIYPLDKLRRTLLNIPKEVTENFVDLPREFKKNVELPEEVKKNIADQPETCKNIGANTLDNIGRIGSGRIPIGVEHINVGIY
jgi:hypothetical protein